MLAVEAMREAVAKIISLCGQDVLADPVRFQAGLSDFLHGNTFHIERESLIMAIRLDVGRQLLYGTEKAASEQNRIIRTAYATLTKGFGMEKTRGVSIIRSLVLALDWRSIKVELWDSLDDSEANNTLCNVKKGDIINFGNYEWEALVVTDDMVLLFLQTIVDVGIPYNESSGNTTWENCTLRKWLNNDFYNRFSSVDKQAILCVDTGSERNQWYGTDAGGATTDRVFLLTVSDIVRFFGDSGKLYNRPANEWNASDNSGLSCAIDDRFNRSRRVKYKGEYTWWWLRSPGESQDKTAYINTDGIIFLSGEFAFDDGGKNSVGVRPAIRPALFVKHQSLSSQAPQKF